MREERVMNKFGELMDANDAEIKERARGMKWSAFDGSWNQYSIWFRIYGYGIAIKNYNSSFMSYIDHRHPCQIG